MADTLLQQLYERVRASCQVPATVRDVERVVAALLATDDVWEAVRLSSAPMRFVCTVWEQMDGLLHAADGKIALTEHGRQLAEAAHLAPARDARCDQCEGRGIDYRKLVGEIADRFAAICRNRPRALQEYDQGYVTETTTLARIALAWQRGDLEGKDIIVLGDDDLMSIAAALTGAPRRVLALDIDERIVDFINEVAAREGLRNLTAVRHDLRQPMPADWHRSFDTFLCDPTESFVGFKAFIERGMICLRGVGSAGYFGLTHVESSLDKWARIQRFLLDCGAVITELRDGFNAYVNWDYVQTMRSWQWLPTKATPTTPWYTSALYRIELLRVPEVSNEPLEGNIFDDEEVATT